MDNDKINSKMKTVEWVIMLILCIAVDITQIVLNIAFGSGILINRLITFGFGALIGGYLQIRGVSLVNPRVMIRFGGTIIGELIPIMDFLPLWAIGTVWTWMTTKSTVVAKATGVVKKASGALNKNGIRMPQSTQPLVVDGIRRPEK
jgi:hypothetical protein